MTPKPSQEMLDKQADFLELHIKEHLPALAKKRHELSRLETARTGRAPRLEVIVPVAWDLLGLGMLGHCFGHPVFAGYVPKPIMRASISDRRIVSEREELLEERLEQRTAALNRTVDQNKAMREALLRVLDKADVCQEAVGTTDVHDAIGYELIQWLVGDPVMSQAPKVVEPITRIGVRDVIERLVRDRIIPKAYGA